MRDPGNRHARVLPGPKAEVYAYVCSGVSASEAATESSRLAMMCTSMPSGAASWEIFLTMEPPLRNSCHRLRALEPTTIWVI